MRGLHGQTVKKNPPCLHGDYYTVRIRQSSILYSFQNTSEITKGATSEAFLTWAGCKVEPCGNKPPRLVYVVWTAASGPRTSCSSEVVQPDMEQMFKKSHQRS